MSSRPEKFSSQMDPEILAELRDYARETNQPISVVLNDAVASHLRRVRVRPAFREAMDKVLETNADLLERLAR